MQDIQLTTSQSPCSLPVKVKDIGSVIYHVNQLSPFTTTDERLIEWAESINEILPELEIEDLKSLIRAFKTDEITYDTRLGIQNIFMGIKLKFPSKYRAITPRYTPDTSLI